MLLRKAQRLVVQSRRGKNKSLKKKIQRDQPEMLEVTANDDLLH